MIVFFGMAFKMSALLVGAWCQMFTRSVGLNSRSFTGVSCFKFCQFHISGSTRILQKETTCGLHSHEKKLAGCHLTVGLHKEPTRCVSDQVLSNDHQPGASAVRPILPFHQRSNGTVHGRTLVEYIIQTATIAANRYCNQQINTIVDGSRRAAALCSLSSVDVLKFFRTVGKTNMIQLTGNVTATSDHLLLVEVTLEKSCGVAEEEFKLMNSARLSFVANSLHDPSQRHQVIPLKSHAGDSGEIHHFQPIPPRERDLGYTIKELSELIHPDASSVTFVHPFHCVPPPQEFCRPEHICRLMEEHGIIMASRLTQHDVVTVQMCNVAFHENVKPGSAVVVSGEIVSTAGDVMSMFLTVDAFFSVGTKVRTCRAADGHFCYVPINSAKERISIPSHQVLSTHGQHFSPDHKEVGIEYSVVESYVNALKK